MKYKVGDKVRVRNDLVRMKKYYSENGVWDDVTDEMLKLLGDVVTIKGSINRKYKIEEDFGKFSWTDEMFTGLVVEDKIVLVGNSTPTLYWFDEFEYKDDLEPLFFNEDNLKWTGDNDIFILVISEEHIFDKLESRKEHTITIYCNGTDYLVQIWAIDRDRECIVMEVE